MTKRKKNLSAILLGAILALGVGAGLSPKEVTKASAANDTHQITLEKSDLGASSTSNKAFTATKNYGTSAFVYSGTTNLAQVSLGFYSIKTKTAEALKQTTAATRDTEKWVLTSIIFDYTKVSTKTDLITVKLDTNEGEKAAFTFTPATNSTSVANLNANKATQTVTYPYSDNIQTFTIVSNLIMWVEKLTLTYEIKPEVIIEPESMELDVEELSLNITESHQLVPNFEPTGAKADVTYAITSQSNPDGVVSVTATGLVTGVRAGTATVTATTTDGTNLSASVNITVTGDYPSNILTPAQAHELASGADVTVRGKVVTDIKNGGAYAIQVGDRGIMTYGIGELTVGHDVIITGKMGAYKGMPQITTSTNIVDLGPSTTTVTPKIITAVSDLTTKLSGTLVQINGMEYVSGTFSTSAASNVDLKLGGTTIVIRATKDIDNSAITAANNIFNTMSEEETLNITTIAGWFDGVQLLFSADSVIQKHLASFGALDHITLNTVNVKNSYYVGESFDLTGLVVTAFDEEGTQKIVTPNATSSLANGYTFVAGDIGNKTITITYIEGTTEQETFSITVAAAPAWTKATLIYPEKSGTSNLETGNSAETLSLDESIFDVRAIKGEANQNVGINNDGTTRLYFHANGGSTLSVSIASEKVINRVVFNFGSTVAKAKIMVDGVEKYNNAPASNGSLSLENLEASSFSIQNVNTSSAQLWIASIEIYYANATNPADIVAVDDFVANYMHPEIDVDYKGIDDLINGYHECTTLGYYATAKSAFNALTEEQRILFLSDTKYEDPRARLTAWAIANGDILNTTTKLLETPVNPSQNAFFNAMNDNNTIMLIVIVSLIGVSVLGGVFYFRKKEQN